MDVQCDRCKTEYEFDDALVSGRGTTVRCTHCGHQFKVRQAEAADSTEDRWVIRTSDGEQVTFLTLRDLQQAILARQIRRADMLLRAAVPPRLLGSITELDPFFEGRTSSRPPPSEGLVTAPVAFPRSVSPWRDGVSGTAPVTPAAGSSMPARTAELYGSPLSSAPAPSTPPSVNTLRPPSDAAAAAPGAVRSKSAPSTSIDGLSEPAGDGQLMPAAARSLAAPSDGREFLRPPTAPIRRSLFPFDDDAASQRHGPPSSGDDPYSARRPGNVGGWIVAFVLFLAVGVVAWALVKPYFVTRDSGAAAQIDPRLALLLSEGEKAMSDGRFDVAQANFDKASVLAEKDPRVLLDEARAAAVEADVPWLKLRLLSPDRVDEVRTTRAQLDEIVARARRFSDEAFAVAPGDVAAARARIDALRLTGDRDGARGYVARVIGQASQPETAYVLAALDLAETAPLWTTIIDRLRLAAGAESNAGRAQAALIYALAKSGDVGSARVELAKFEAAVRPYPLLPDLHEFVDRSGSGPAGVTSVAPPPPDSAPTAALPPVASSAAARAAAPAAADVNPSDPRVAMQSAAQALKRADFAGARQIYQGVVDRNPSDSEAITGLGDVARLQGDSSGAVAAYRRAIAVNPSYLPALLGLADTQWVQGDHISATKAYGDIVDRFPEGTYPRYVSQRAGEGTASASAIGTGTGTSTATPQASGTARERTE